ncbi:MAG: hypothetical protein ABW061_16830 [Polyangiaceae bacterium]
MTPTSMDTAPVWLLAARVDLRRAEIVRRDSAPGGSGIAEEDGVLFAAIEMLRSEDSPKRIFLLSEQHVHLYEVSPDNPLLATVLVAPRASNLGLLLGELRTVVRRFEQ